jgi:adenylate cyclase
VFHPGLSGRSRTDLSGERSGEVGRVNISEATYELVKNEPGLAFTLRGKVQAKGKGEMEMYFVARS